MRVTITDQAREDLLQIGSYLVERNPDAAIRLMQTFREKFNLLANFPRLGRERNDLLLDLRCLIVKDYLVFYQLGDDVIEIYGNCYAPVVLVFGSVGRPASCQAVHPPVRARAFFHPACLSSCATRALVASFVQVQ